MVFIKPGDSVKFTNMAGHDTVAIEGMIPDGAKPWKLAMNAEFSVTLDKEDDLSNAPRTSGTACWAPLSSGKAPPAYLYAIKAHPQNKVLYRPCRPPTRKGSGGA